MAGELHRLSNGIRVLMDPIPESGIVTGGLFFTIGSRVETPATAGYAHMVEHDVFRGTARRSWKQIADSFDDLGANPDAFTGTDMTGYTVKTLPGDFPAAFDILCDMICNPVFPADAVRLEHQAILEEIKQDEDDLDQKAGQQSLEAAYPGQSFSASILGTVASVGGATPDALKAFMRSHYHTGNLVIGLAGAFDPEAILRDIESRMAEFPQGTPSEIAPAVFRPGYRHGYENSQQTHLDVIFNAKAIRKTRATLLAEILGGKTSSRLFREVREERGLAYMIGAGVDNGVDTGALNISAAVGHEKVRDALEVIARTLRKVVQEGVSDAELHRVKKAAEVDLAECRFSAGSRLRVLVNNFTQRGAIRTLDDILRDTHDTTREDINETASAILSAAPALSLVGRRPPAKAYKGFLKELGAQ